MTQNVKRMLKILNIEEQEIEKLEEVSHRELAEAYLKAHHELGGKGLPYIGKPLILALLPPKLIHHMHS